MKALLLLILLMLPVFSFAWDGYDYEKGDFIEIEKGNLIRPGNDIEIYDYNSGTYKDVEVQSIQKNGSTTEIEVYDNESGEYRTFDMEGK